MSENGEIYTAGKNFTLPPALTALTNFTSVFTVLKLSSKTQRQKYEGKMKKHFTQTTQI